MTLAPDGVEDRRRTDGGAVEIGGVVLPRPRPSWRRSSRVARKRVTAQPAGVPANQKQEGPAAQHQMGNGARLRGRAKAQCWATVVSGGGRDTAAAMVVTAAQMDSSRPCGRGRQQKAAGGSSGAHYARRQERRRRKQAAGSAAAAEDLDDSAAAAESTGGFSVGQLQKENADLLLQVGQNHIEN